MPMIDSGFYNMDCMEGMKQFPDEFFDLAIVDPPYGINVASHVNGALIGGGGGATLRRQGYIQCMGQAQKH